MGSASTKQQRVETTSRQGSAKPAARKQYPSSIDGGQFLPLGLYPSAADDFDHDALRRFISQRLLAPIYKGLPESPEGEMVNHTTGSDGKQTPRHRNEADDDDKPLSSLVQSNLISVRDGTSSIYSSSDLTFYMSPSELYRNAVECPICFLYYPQNINYTMCCHQPICTECFLQIKRPESTMDPASCPYCTQEAFAVYYIPPQKLYDYKALREQQKKSRADRDPRSLGSESSESIPVISSHPSKSGKDDRVYSASAPSASSSMAKSHSSKSLAADDLLNVILEDEPTDILGLKPEHRRRLVLGQQTFTVSSDDIRPEWQQKHRELLLERAQQQQRQLRIQLLATARQQGSGSTAGLSRDNAYDLRRMEDLSGAASTVAALVEHLSGLHTAISGDSSVVPTASHGVSSARSLPHTARSSRHGNSGSRTHSVQIETAVRSMGSDMEELMLMEAVRRSLLDAEDQREHQQQQDSLLRES